MCAAAAEAAAAGSAAAPQQRDQIATIVGAGRARRGPSGGGDVDGNGPMEETEAADFANYFYSYAELDHQKQMLEDERCSICTRSGYIDRQADRQSDRHMVEYSGELLYLVQYHYVVTR